MKGLGTTPAQLPQGEMFTSAPAVPSVPLPGRAALTPYQGLPPGRHSCITRREDDEHPWTRAPMPACPPARLCPGSLPARRLLRRCPGSSTGRPRCPRSHCLSLARDKPVAEQLVWLSPALDQLGLSLSFRAAPDASYSPSAPQPAPLALLHARLLPPKGAKRGKTKPGGIFPAALQGYSSPRRRVPPRKAPAASLRRCPALPSPEHPTFEHEASFVSESSPKGVGLPPLF